MMTNEQVLQAVNRLTETYNALQENLALLQQGGRLPSPLYRNAYIAYDGKEDENPIAKGDILNVGTGSIDKPSLWYGQYFIPCRGEDVIKTGTQLPKNYVVIKMKPVSEKDGTFFINQAHDANWKHGIISVYLCKPETKEPIVYLGSSCPDKHAETGKSVVFGPDNNLGWVRRYYQWLSFNYNASDIKRDADGYAYFAVSSSVATWYLGGYAIAERVTDFVWTGARIFDLDFYQSKSKSVHHGLYEQLTLSRFDAASSHFDVRLPYQKQGKALIIGVLLVDDSAVPSPLFFGHITKALFPSDSIAAGNFPAVRGSISRFRWMTVHISAEEAAKNTIELQGLKLLRLNITVPICERHFYFAGMFTETVQ